MKLNIGDKVEFKATNRFGEDTNFTSNGKVTVLSIYPSINTKICDMQTQISVKNASKYPNINFTSISLDKTEEISKWCGVNSSDNITIISDRKYKEFSDMSGLKMKLIPAFKRGLIVLDQDNVITHININENVKEQVDFEWLENILENEI